MVIVQLQGGLGNQLFQYAFGRAVSAARDTELKLDLARLRVDDKRDFELDNFNIRAEIADEDEVESLYSRAYTSRLIDNLMPLRRRRVVKQQAVTFDPKMLEAGASVYLEGYWQSEKYFKSVEDAIREELTFRCEPSEINREMLHEISTADSASLHVRRGDYATDPVTNQAHGTCSIAYYQQAAKVILDKSPNAHFFLFSDDPDWVVENLALDFPTTYVNQNNGGQSFEDLRLISHCKNHIIANSSFSWWGAWLSANANKMVVAPSAWFSNPLRDTSDIVPETWIRL